VTIAGSWEWLGGEPNQRMTGKVTGRKERGNWGSFIGAQQGGVFAAKLIVISEKGKEMGSWQHFPRGKTRKELGYGFSREGKVEEAWG